MTLIPLNTIEPHSLKNNRTVLDCIILYQVCFEYYLIIHVQFIKQPNSINRIMDLSSAQRQSLSDPANFCLLRGSGNTSLS